MNWTMDLYAMGKKGCYRLKYMNNVCHVQLLTLQSGHWETVIRDVKLVQGRVPAVDEYDAK